MRVLDRAWRIAVLVIFGLASFGLAMFLFATLGQVWNVWDFLLPGEEGGPATALLHDIITVVASLCIAAIMASGLAEALDLI